jgi:hypothetical protein
MDLYPGVRGAHAGLYQVGDTSSSFLGDLQSAYSYTERYKHMQFFHPSYLYILLLAHWYIPGISTHLVSLQEPLRHAAGPLLLDTDTTSPHRAMAIATALVVFC